MKSRDIWLDICADCVDELTNAWPVILVAIAVFAALLWAAWLYIAAVDDCERRGGRMVRAPTGYACVKALEERE